MSDQLWQDRVAVLKSRVDLLDRDLIREVTNALHAAYDWLDSFMERYCAITCPACRDVCCEATGVFFNLTDLLAILALGLDPPPGQTRTALSEPCRYLAPGGCSLRRTVRPYVCVWYFCEAQMCLYGVEPASTQRQLLTILQSLRGNRLSLESHYENRFPPVAPRAARDGS